MLQNMAYIKNSVKILFNVYFVLALIGCTGPNRLELEQSWAEKTINNLTIREKIGQMMVLHMNMRFLNEEDPKWKEITSLLESDGIGGIHIWFGDVGHPFHLSIK